MAILQMRKISICALKKDRTELLDTLQALGLVQLSEVPEAEGFCRDSTAEEKSAEDRRVNLAEQAMGILEQTAPEKKSMFAAFEGRREISGIEARRAGSRRDEVIRKAEDIVAHAKEMAENRAAVQKLENQIETLKPWLSYGLPMNSGGTEETALLAGTLPTPLRLDDVTGAVLEKCGDDVPVDVNLIAQETDTAYVAVICMRSDRTQVEDALRSIGFARFWQDSDRTPAERTEDYRKEIADLTRENERLAKEIAAMKEIRPDLEVISDEARLASGRLAAMEKIPESEETFVLTGYTAAENVPVLERALGRFSCAFDAEEVAADDEEAPTILRNNAFSRNMEGVVASYGLPNRHELDPTTIMSFFYVFFFGMMLSDAAYGAVIAACCFLLVHRYPRMGREMKKTLTMFMYCGISTVVWGVLFGGYFGDLVNVVSRVFFGHEAGIPALWFVPLDNPMKLLLYSMLFGLIHLFTGLAIKGYNELKAHDYMGFFVDVACWYLFLIGLILMLLPTSLFEGISQMHFAFSPGLVTFSHVITLTGMAGIILFTERGTKNPLLRIALGLYGVYGVTGWLSDVLSYSRLLALGLATGVIAQVINQMGSMGGAGIGGAVMFIVIFVIGHLMNMGINILGAYVHTNRLQYVEFFGKFYDGSGKPFEPFASETKYVEINHKED
ncbi:V-type ATP synthase subunit I [Clostridium vitabionis]|uniref:V-type ATP synthase subunit I n=1 Tax=Clostridium vitabionis TaxID=2784388 RepID=UPI00188B9C73|nr:V-type ATP synthase subunit I [Clostridium vitabionis]